MYRIEPVQGLWLAAIADITAITLAKVPQSNLIEIVQSECPRDRIDKGCLRHGLRYYMAQVQFQKVDAPHDGVMITCTADLDQNEKDQGEKEKEGSQKRKDEARASCCP